MNKIIILVGLGLFTQFQSQELQKTMIPKISNKFEKFDIDKFSKSTKKETDVVREFLPNGNYIEMSRQTLVNIIPNHIKIPIL